QPLRVAGRPGPERVVEGLARPPQILKPHLPRRPGNLEEPAGGQAEVPVEETGEGDGGALADANDAQIAGMNDPNGQVRDLELQRQGGHEAGAAAAEDDDVSYWIHAANVPRGGGGVRRWVKNQRLYAQSLTRGGFAVRYFIRYP